MYVRRAPFDPGSIRRAERKFATDENRPETCRKTTAGLGCRNTRREGAQILEIEGRENHASVHLSRDRPQGYAAKLKSTWR